MDSGTTIAAYVHRYLHMNDDRDFNNVMRRHKCRSLDYMMLCYILEQFRDHGLPTSAEMRKYARSMTVAQNNGFLASPGWLKSFKQRHNDFLVANCGDSNYSKVKDGWRIEPKKSEPRTLIESKLAKYASRRCSGKDDADSSIEIISLN